MRVPTSLILVAAFITACPVLARDDDAQSVDTPAPSLRRYLEDFAVAPPIGVVQSAATPGDQSASTGVPPGFEALMLEQTTLVDIYFANRFLVATLATFTPGSIRLESPSEIVDLIETLLDQAAVLLRSARNSAATVKCAVTHRSRRTAAFSRLISQS